MGKPIVKVYGASSDGSGGREIRFCCDNCPPKFEADLTKMNKFYFQISAAMLVSGSVAGGGCGGGGGAIVRTGFASG